MERGKEAFADKLTECQETHAPRQTSPSGALQHQEEDGNPFPTRALCFCSRFSRWHLSLTCASIRRKSTRTAGTVMSLCLQDNEGHCKHLSDDFSVSEHKCVFLLPWELSMKTTHQCSWNFPDPFSLLLPFQASQIRVVWSCVPKTVGNRSLSSIDPSWRDRYIVLPFTFLRLLWMDAATACFCACLKILLPRFWKRFSRT